MKKNFTKRAGFTLVETLVAIAVLILAVSGAFSAAQTGLSTSTLSKEQVTAFYLAQEQIEALRNIRDENGLAEVSGGAGWITNIHPSCFANPSANGCQLDVECWWSHPYSPCGPPGSYFNSGLAGYLKVNPSTGFYQDNGSNSWADTIYKRKINIDNVSSDEISVLVTVEWSKGAITRKFQVRENLMDWQY